MTDTTLDRLSLTLPNWRAALKRRIKRPPKPDWTALICVALNMIFAVQNYLQGKLFLAVTDIILLCLWWKLVWLHDHRLELRIIVLIIGVIIVQVVA